MAKTVAVHDMIEVLHWQEAGVGARFGMNMTMTVVDAFEATFLPTLEA